MNKNHSKVVKMVSLALIAAIEVILTLFPIQVGTISLNLGLTPIIIAAIIFGPVEGCAIGVVSGLVTAIQVITAQSPFYVFLVATNPVAAFILCIVKTALAGLAASCALATTDLPFGGPISEVRVCRINGEFVINPTFSEMKNSDLELMVAATEENIMMVEGEMNEVSEHDMLEAIKFAHEEIKKHCRVQKELMHELGTDVNKRDYPHDIEDEELKKAVHDFCYSKCYELAKAAKPKHEREDGFKAIKEEFLATIPEEEREMKEPLVSRYYHAEEKEAMRNMILDEGKRLDGRVCDEVRPIWCEVDYLPCAHGSAIFTRGETQSLATVTLGTKMDMKETDEVLIQDDQQFVLHYNFPPFATGEAKPQRGVGRREIGHGHLAWRAVKGMIPADFTPRTQASGSTRS